MQKQWGNISKVFKDKKINKQSYIQKDYLSKGKAK